MHVHCPVCKQVQISYVSNQATLKNVSNQATLKNLRLLRLELQRKMDFYTKKRDRSYKGKRHGAQEKGMALQEKGMAQRHAKRA